MNFYLIELNYVKKVSTRNFYHSTLYRILAKYCDPNTIALKSLYSAQKGKNRGHRKETYAGNLQTE